MEYINIYQTAYDLLNNYIFGGTVVVNTYPDFVCVLLSSLMCIFCVALPFIIVWRIIRLFL